MDKESEERIQNWGVSPGGDPTTDEEVDWGAYEPVSDPFTVPFDQDSTGSPSGGRSEPLGHLPGASELPRLIEQITGIHLKRSGGGSSHMRVRIPRGIHGDRPEIHVGTNDPGTTASNPPQTTETSLQPVTPPREKRISIWLDGETSDAPLPSLKVGPNYTLNFKIGEGSRSAW
jgi:hypothetical protein